MLKPDFITMTRSLFVPERDLSMAEGALAQQVGSLTNLDSQLGELSIHALLEIPTKSRLAEIERGGGRLDDRTRVGKRITAALGMLAANEREILEAAIANQEAFWGPTVALDPHEKCTMLTHELTAYLDPEFE